MPEHEHEDHRCSRTPAVSPRASLRSLKAPSLADERVPRTYGHRVRGEDGVGCLDNHAMRDHRLEAIDETTRHQCLRLEPSINDAACLC